MAAMAFFDVESKSIDQQDERCTYRTCRHAHSQHGKSWKKANGKRTGCKCKHFTVALRPQRKAVIQETEDFKRLDALLRSQVIHCRWCDEPLSAYDIEQDSDLSDEPWTYVHCPSCRYDWAAWKIFRMTEKVELVQ